MQTMFRGNLCNKIPTTIITQVQVLNHFNLFFCNSELSDKTNNNRQVLGVKPKACRFFLSAEVAQNL